MYSYRPKIFIQQDLFKILYHTNISSSNMYVCIIIKQILFEIYFTIFICLLTNKRIHKIIILLLYSIFYKRHCKIFAYQIQLPQALMVYRNILHLFYIALMRRPNSAAAVPDKILCYIFLNSELFNKVAKHS